MIEHVPELVTNTLYSDWRADVLDRFNKLGGDWVDYGEDMFTSLGETEARSMFNNGFEPADIVDAEIDAAR